MAEMIVVDISDLEKILDTLRATKRFLEFRDKMNAEVHLAKETRYSPLTSEVAAQCDRVQTLLDDSANKRPLLDRPDKSWG